MRVGSNNGECGCLDFRKSRLKGQGETVAIRASYHEHLQSSMKKKNTKHTRERVTCANCSMWQDQYAAEVIKSWTGVECALPMLPVRPRLPNLLYPPSMIMAVIWTL